MSGKKIIDGLKEAAAGNFSRVTLDGQVWVREYPSVPPKDKVFEEWRAKNFGPYAPYPIEAYNYFIAGWHARGRAFSEG